MFFPMSEGWLTVLFVKRLVPGLRFLALVLVLQLVRVCLGIDGARGINVSCVLDDRCDGSLSVNSNIERSVSKLQAAVLSHDPPGCSFCSYAFLCIVIP